MLWNAEKFIFGMIWYYLANDNSFFHDLNTGTDFYISRCYGKLKRDSISTVNSVSTSKIYTGGSNLYENAIIAEESN